MADYDLNEYNGDALVGTAAFFLGLSWLCVGLRTYTRARLTKAFQSDDWLMLISQAIFTLSCVFIIHGVQVGIGRHNDAITDDRLKVQALKYQALAAATYIIDMMFVKLSIGIFLLRLAVERVYKWIIRFSLAIITVWSTATFIWDVFQCTPVDKQWDYTIQGGHCASAASVVSGAYALSVLNVLSDWLYALLPIFMIWKVNMTFQAKLTVIFVLGLGIFASVATLVRLKFLADLENIDDILFAATDAMVWTLVEPGVAIVAASLATIRPFLRKLRIRGFESSGRCNSEGSNLKGPGRTRQTGNTTVGNEAMRLEAVEPEYSVKPHMNLTALSLTLCDQNTSQQDIRSQIQSEPHTLNNPESTVITPPWQNRTYSSSNRSLEQIHDLEAQNQENPKFGLGNEQR